MAFAPIDNAVDEKNKARKNKQGQVGDENIVQTTEAVLIEMFGEDQAAHAKPLFLKNRTLTVTCSASDIAQEIRINQMRIVEKINDKLGKNEVDRIRYLA